MDRNIIVEYIEKQPLEIQSRLMQLHNLIKKLIPNSVEVIKYGMPTYVVNNKNFVHFAGYKNHIGFYPTPSPIEMFKEDLKEYKYSKGAIQFPLDKPLPLSLIKRILKFRIGEFIKYKND